MKDGMNQEILTLTRIEKRGRTLNAYCDDWQDTNGMKMVVHLGSIWAEHKRLIARAGYTLHEGKGLDIPVMITQTRGSKGLNRRIRSVWGKDDGHIYSLSTGEDVNRGDLIFPIQNGDTCYKVLEVLIENATPPYSNVRVTVAIHKGTREYNIDRTKEYVVIRQADIAPENVKAINF